MAQNTLLDIVTMNGADGVVGLIEEAHRYHPELEFGAARTIKGTSYKTLVRTAVPVGAFRDANEGAAYVKSTYVNRRFETYIFNPRWKVDKAVADRHEDGALALIGQEAEGIVEGALQGLSKQFYYGTETAYGGQAKGFPGLIDAVDSSKVLDATGSTAVSTSSCWAVKFGAQNVQWLYGAGGDFGMDVPKIETVQDSNSLDYTAYTQEMLAYPGLQVASNLSLGRIHNLTTQAGKMLTDDLLAEFLTLFLTGRQPDMLLCTRIQLEELRKSRTATNATGEPAPRPDSFMGIPIRTTESLSDIEAVNYGI